MTLKFCILILLENLNNFGSGQQALSLLISAENSPRTCEKRDFSEISDQNEVTAPSCNRVENLFLCRRIHNCYKLIYIEAQPDRFMGQRMANENKTFRSVGPPLRPGSVNYLTIRLYCKILNESHKLYYILPLNENITILDRSSIIGWLGSEYVCWS